MDASEKIEIFKEFIEEFYLDELLNNVRKKDNYLVLDFNELAKFNIDLANDLLENAEEGIISAGLAAKECDLPEDADRIIVRFINLPETQKLPLRNIRTEHIKKFWVFEGVVRQKSDVLPQVISAKFECPSCGNIISLLQLDKQLREPTRCGCGRKGKFHLLSKDLINAQGLVLEENTEDLDGGNQAKRRQFILKDDLVSPLADKRTIPGTKVRITGVLNSIAKETRHGGKSTTENYVIESNYVESLEDSYDDINVNEEDLKKIKKISEDPNVFENLKNSLAPSIYGYDEVKSAILLQLFGGVKRKRKDGTTLRGDTHIFLIGDPGAGKSKMLERVQKVAPKSRYVSGKGVSGAGLTAAVTRDEFSGTWALEAGALVLANRGFVMIDEMDKMSGDDRAAMHEALEQQKVSISKANIQATLKSETTVLAAANPKHSRFDPYEMVAKQIDLPLSLINRFDLIFPIRDLADEEQDFAKANFVISMHQEESENEQQTNDDIIEDDIFRKYIAYARKNIFPSIPKNSEVEEMLANYYKNIRNAGDNNNKNKPISISLRQLEGIIRLAEASAKLRLSPIVAIEDAKRAITLMEFCLQLLGTDPETGKVDIDRISSNTSASQRSRISKIKRIIAELLPNKGDKVLLEDVLIKATEKDISEDDAVQAIEKLKRTGDIFSFKRGKYISRDV